MQRTLSARKAAVLANAERNAATRQASRRAVEFFHGEDLRYLRFLIPDGLRVLEIGCGTADVLAGVKPSHGLGIDFSAAMIAEARGLHPDLDLRVGDVEDPAFVASLFGPFDAILIVDTFGSLDDCQAALEGLHRLCTRDTRIVIAYYSHLWQPLLALAEWIGWRPSQPPQNVLSPADIAAIATLADFEPIKTERRLISPFRLFGLGRFLNRFVSILPGIKHLSLRHYLVCRSLRERGDQLRSATVVIPALNERGNIAEAVARIPVFCEDLEIIFVEGHSSDGTLDEMRRVAAANAGRDIKVMVQPHSGKADAVFAAFDVARGDVLAILDADLTVPPEQLPKFWQAIASGKGEFINGSRLIYSLEAEAMRFLNLIANRGFSLIFTWLLGQRVTDTLCGTKVIRRTDYEKLKRGRGYFNAADPFGDFDLILGAAKLNLRLIEVPVRYSPRTYGTSKISRFRHGMLLLKMVILAFLKMKAI